MAAKGKWAQGIKPRHFHWIIQDQLAVCERPGGFGANHRKVRRQEEIIWIREQGFDLVQKSLPPPISQEFFLVLQDQSLGMPFERALKGLSTRVPSNEPIHRVAPSGESARPDE